MRQLNLLGLVYDLIEQRIVSNELLIGGRYWLGIGHKILRFPRTQQGIIFADSQYNEDSTYPSLIARTIEGLPFQLQIAVYYILTTANDDLTKANQLKIIYENFG